MANVINNVSASLESKICNITSNAENIKSRHPLLAMEKGLLFHALSNDTESFYVSQGEYFLAQIDSQLFWKAWQYIIQHYDILRSCFIENDAGFIEHIVYSHVACAIRMVNFETLSATQAEDAYQAIRQQDIQTPFDLTTPPLMRLMLCQMPQQKYRFVWTYHHLLLDLRSTFHILDDVMRYYEAVSRQQVIIFPPEISKSEILAQLPQLETAEAQVYWQNFFKNYESGHELPFVGLKNQKENAEISDEYAFSTGEPLYIALKQFSHKHRLTPSLIVHAAWGLTLCSYLNRDDIVFGSIRSLPYAWIKNSAGLFINNLPMRIHFDHETTVLECLNEVREQHRQLKKYWNTSLGDIQAWIKLPAEQNLFNTCLSFSTQESSTLIEKHLGDQFRQLQFKFRSKTHYPLMLEFFVQGNSLLGRFTAREGLFSQKMLEHMAAQLNSTIQELISNPQKKICHFSWISGKDCQLLNHWNETSRPISKCTLTLLLEEQANRTPECIAVQFEDIKLTYFELNAQANQLAHWLQEEGVKNNVIVAVYMSPCIELPIALLAIVKVGGCYLPLDVKMPTDRVCDIFENSQTRLVLTTSKWKNNLNEIVNNLDFCKIKTFFLDKNDQLKKYVQNNLRDISKPNDNIYIIYTSGSTGKPKGVISHNKGLVNRLNWMKNILSVKKTDRILQKTSIGFDVSVWEFFLAWLVGARTVIGAPDTHYDFDVLVEIINTQKITILHFVPTVLSAFLQYDSASTCQSIRHVISSGEALDSKTANQCLALWPNAKLYNLYGPTEASIDVSYHLCKKNNNHPQVPIGKPIDNTQLFVLNHYKQLVPIGGIGELHIGGIGVAKGYLNQDRLTAKNFIENSLPESVESTLSKILYKTGDLATWSLDGELHFLGRVDNQIKWHGARIELSEIEHQLLRQNSIKQCVVVLQKNQGHEYLVAYCVGSDFPESTSQLYKALAKYLPNYMMPSHFIWLDSLPLLANGKTNRAALPLPLVHNKKEPEKSQTFENKNILEKLQSVWKEVLRIDSVEINDNLFEIGGDSISVIQIVNKVRALGMNINPRWIFNQPTIFALSKLVSSRKEPDIKQLADKGLFETQIFPVEEIISEKYNALHISPNVKSFGIKDVYPLSPIQQGILFHSVQKKTQDPYICQYSFTLTGDLNLIQFRKVWQKLMHYYEMLRTGFFADNKGTYSQVVLLNCPLPMEIIDLSAEPYAKAHESWQHILEKDRRKGFPFDNPPLFRIILAVLANNQYICLLSMHHIIHDAWSITLLFEKLRTLYNDHLSALDGNANKNARGYKDFVVKQLKKDQKSAIYWRKLLDGFDSALQLDICSLNSASGSVIHSCEKLNLNESLCKKLSAFAKSHKTTLNIVVQSAWSILLNRYTHQNDIVYGTVLSGRTVDLPDIQEQFGLFLQTIPIRVKITQSLTVHQLIQQLSQQFQVGTEYAHYPLPEIQSDHFDGEKKSLFDHLIIFENYPFLGNMKDGLINLTIDSIEVYALTHYSMSLLVMTEPNIQLNLFYDNKKFSRKAIKSFLSHFENLLEEVEKFPEKLTNELSLLSKKQLKNLMLFSQTEKNIFHENVSIYGLFSRQVMKNPLKTSCFFKNKTLTYKELNEVVLRLSKSLEIESGEIVGLYFLQGTNLIISILALLNKGCTYLPIDPKASQNYIRHICSENHLRTILTDNELYPSISSLVADEKIDIVSVDKFLNDIKIVTSSLEPSKINDFPTYIMYTSGSTGKTKGVAISQPAIINLLLALNHVIEFQSGDCFLATTAYTFDISLIEWLLPLVTGGTCILLSPEQLADDDLLNRLGKDYSHMFIQTTPSVWNSVIRKENWKINCPLTILSGGEILDYHLAKKLLEKSPNVFNCYGPTEATIWSTIYKVNQVPQNILPIGKPLLNTTAYVLDECLNLVPIGLTGELYLGGKGLMQTYIGENSDFLNKEKLIKNPFQKNELLYKTGDKVCWLPDGNLQFLGRFDDQVKIRGFRVDLNQIASVLETHDFVKKAIIVKQDKKMHSASLIAYLLLEDKNILSSSDEQIGEIHCDQWEVIYDRLYQKSSDNTAFDTTGWISSYTGKSLPKADMHEWVLHTVDQISDLAPQRILEIGCGMGLLLLAIAPICQSYHGIDISSAALRHIAEQLADKSFKNKVTLSQGNANTCHLSAEIFYDTVIVNSVIQYFPHVHYLLDVLDRAIKTVTSGGQVFIGDVRSYAHLKHFHASVVLHRAENTDSLESLKHRYFKYLHQEKELVIDPLFFIDYAKHHARITHVNIQLKTGQCENEMNDYRYDVILQIEKPSIKKIKTTLLDWQKEKLTTTSLAQNLLQQLPMIHLVNIPNMRWDKANKLIARFDHPADNLLLAECAGLFSQQEEQMISPFDLKSIAEIANYEVHCVFSEQKNMTCFDAILRLKSKNVPCYLGQTIAQTNTPINWQNYANKPWQVSCYKKIYDSLQQYLLDKLPHYMLPSAFVLIDEVPVTANGKLNKKALANYEHMVTSEYQAANTDIEQALIDIWKDTLGIDKEIGVKDNFFQLGGHSLNALQVVNTISERWHITLDVTRLFETPTVVELAREIQITLSADSKNKHLSSSLVMLKKTGKKPPLFMIHPVGGTVFCYIPLSESLSIDHPIIGIQDPGITNPDLLFNSLIQMATHYIQLIKTKQSHGPYYLMGASLGGTLATEIAYQLTEQGDEVAFIGLFDTWAAFTETFHNRERLEKTLWRQHKFLKKRLKNYDIANPELWLDLNYQRLQLLLQYQHSMIKQTIYLFKAQDIEPEYQDLNEASNHWSLYTTQPVKVYAVPGNHESILVEPNVAVLAEMLAVCLEEVDSSEF